MSRTATSRLDRAWESAYERLRARFSELYGSTGDIGYDDGYEFEDLGDNMGDAEPGQELTRATSADLDDLLRLIQSAPASRRNVDTFLALFPRGMRGRIEGNLARWAADGTWTKVYEAAQTAGPDVVREVLTRRKGGE